MAGNSTGEESKSPGDGSRGVLISNCPNCGKAIALEASKLGGDETVICDNCHEVIGIISDKI